MPSTRDIKAGAAYVELFLKDNRFVRGLKLAEKKLKAFGAGVASVGKRMLAIGGAMAAPMLLAAKSFASAGDTLHKMAARTGVAVETLSQLGYAAELSGTNLETVGQAIQKMNRRIGRMTAGQGSKTQVAAIEELGLSLEALSRMSPEQQFMALADAMANYGNMAEAAGLAQRAFGTQIDQLLPLFADGAEGVRKMMREADRLGLTMSNEDAEAAALFTDRMTKLSSVLKRVVFNIGAALAGTLGDVTEKLTDGARRVAKFIRENQQLIKIALKVAAGIAAAGAALLAVGLAIQVVGGAFGAVAAVITGFATAIGAVISIVGALLTPLGALSAAVIAVGIYFAKSSGVAGTAMGWLGEKFTELYETAKKVFKGIGDALAAGDIQLAGRILWLALKVEWTKGVNALREIWVGFKQIFLETWTNAVFGLAKIFVKAVAIIKEVWINLTDALAAKWNWAQKHISKGIGWIIAKVEGLDPEEVLADIERQYGLKESQRRRRTQAKLAEVETQREETLAALEEEQERRNRQRQERYGQQLADQQKELQDLIRERDEAIREAAKAAEEARARGGPPGLRERLEGILDDLEIAPVGAGGPTPEGTFSAFAAARMGRNTLAERTAKACEDTAKHTKNMDERGRLRGGIPVIA